MTVNGIVSVANPPEFTEIRISPRLRPEGTVTTILFALTLTTFAETLPNLTVAPEAKLLPFNVRELLAGPLSGERLLRTGTLVAPPTTRVMLVSVALPSLSTPRKKMVCVPCDSFAVTVPPVPRLPSMLERNESDFDGR